VALLNPKVDSKVGICIFPAAPPPVPPVVSDVNPPSGTTAGDTRVTITGSNFKGGVSVTVGGAAATSVVWVNSSTIVARTPAHATGKVAVTVTNPDGLSGTLNDAYFYAPPPSATDFYTLAPCRLIDTRNPNGPLGGPALSASQVRTFTVVGGSCGVPSGAKAIAVNVTVVTPAAAGNLQIFPGNAFPLGTSSINFKAGEHRANNGTLTLATNGTGTIGVQNASAGSTHFLLDVFGYFQ
jgi:hypothetical protein